MRYFELFDQVNIRGRWHLGAVVLPDGQEPVLARAVPLNPPGVLTGVVIQPGLVLDYCHTSFNVPVATSPLAEAVQSIAGADVQCVPLVVAAQSGLVVLNVLRVIACLDESRSEFIKWTTADHRADLAGAYRQVTKLVLSGDRIPHDAHLFRIDGWKVALVVSEVLKDAMEQAGCRGAKFTLLET